MVQGHFVSCDNILNTAYGAFFLLYVLLCGASSSCLSDLYLLQLRVQLFYDAEIRQNERVLSVSLRGNFEKIRIMTTFGSRVTQRGRQFEVRALQIFSFRTPRPQRQPACAICAKKVLKKDSTRCLLCYKIRHANCICSCC